LRDAVRAVLDGKEVKVLTKEPDAKEDRDKPNAEVNDVLNRNRSPAR
jgi:hypothetical protein